MGQLCVVHPSDMDPRGTYCMVSVAESMGTHEQGISAAPTVWCLWQTVGTQEQGEMC